MTRGGIDHERLQVYLRDRLTSDAVNVVEVIQYPRGVSRQTWFVRLSGPAGECKGLVIRRDLEGGSVDGTPLRHEYEVYRRLAASEIPVARPLWYEDEPTRLSPGPEFYVREFVDGDWDIQHFHDKDPAYDQVRVAAGQEHLRKLALVHTCDWEGLGFAELFDPPPSAKACALHTLARLAAKLSAFQVEAFPEITAGLVWLREHAPREAPCVSLCKGTNGLGEEVWRDGVIVAMSDWELASLGDPTYDLAQVQDLLPPAEGDGWNLSAALRFYSGVSGIMIEPESLAYYRTVYAVEMAAYALNSARLLVTGEDHLARLGWVGTEVLYRARRTLATVAGILPSDPLVSETWSRPQ